MDAKKEIFLKLQQDILLWQGRLQREGQVVHVIVSKCFDFTKMLGKLVQREVDDLPILTLAQGDEKSAPYPAQDKRSQVREQVPKEAFHGGRNFR
jgi:error-prone DNA polymerase